MPYLCDPTHDLPTKWKQKRIIFYAQGLKVYGELPYLLRQRLRAEFFSNSYHNGEFGLIAPAMEPNYTVVSYNQPVERSTALLDWLFADTGFEWAIAAPEEFKLNIWQSTVCSPGIPNTWVPAENSEGWRGGFQKVMVGVEIPKIKILLNAK